jgi:16S rRNA (adenine1518-N6/adenine1519-N6)-dimethyltransferase
MTLTTVRQALAELGLRPSKALGQNFLTDQNIHNLILRHADLRPTETVLEIGPGLGALTGSLLQQAGRVFAIEKDRRLCHYLRERLPGLELTAGDAVAALRAGFTVPDPDFKVVANLPYSISSPVLECLVERRGRPRLMVLMLQREVAHRLAATPRHKDYGALTVFTQLHYHVTIVHIVSARCFFPAPRVDSAIVVLERREPRVPLLPGAPFHEIVRRGFSQRRKMLRNLLPAGNSSTARAEELSLDEWIALANSLAPAGSRPA